MKIKLITAFAAATAAFALSANAAVVTPVIAYGHNNTDNYGGNITDTWNGSGMNDVKFADDQVSWPPTTAPSTWTKFGGDYHDEWQADQLLDINSSIDAKMGWIIFDLGSVTAGLDEMYLWNNVQNKDSGVADFRLHYSTAPVVPGTTGPTGGSDADDYDFNVGDAGDWTQVGGTQNAGNGDANGSSADGVYALGGVSARYVAIEMLSRQNGNTNPDNGRIGLSEVGFTTIPEPTTTALLGLGGLALIFRRRK